MADRSVPFPTGEHQSVEGRRVVLLYTDDEYTELRPGDSGVIRYIDDGGTVHIDWDNGSRLGLIPGIDKWRVL